jgi:alkaline phosphatase D
MMKSTFNRRAFLQTAGALLLAPSFTHAEPSFKSDPFTLGIASGAPSSDGFVLWTRLAPVEGLDPVAIPVNWEVAADEAFKHVILRGVENAEPHLGHSVHVEVNGLPPGLWYWYRFTSGDAVSAIGRTRTMPPIEACGSMRFAFASCQHYEEGYYTAHQHLAEEKLDLVIFLGDYIYEGTSKKIQVRYHETSKAPHTLQQYRDRYAHYKKDKNLQRCHERFPWIVTWDDHEVVNDYANDQGVHADPDFLLRRAAAYQAYYEHMPLRRSMRPNGANARLYEVYDFGSLARFYVLDDRQYRDHQACPKSGEGGANVVKVTKCPERLDKKRTLLGMEQEGWLAKQFAQTKTKWNIVAQQTLMAQMNREPSSATPKVWTDAWDGYPAARERLLNDIVKNKVANPLVIGGDVHANYVCDVKMDFTDKRSPIIASEFCGTSLTSHGPKQEKLNEELPYNPHIKLARSDKRGYVTIELNEKQARAQLRVVESVDQPGSSISTLASFVVQNGRAGAERE